VPLAPTPTIGQIYTVPQYQDDLAEIFSKPGITHKFVKGLKEKNPEAEVYRKSGSWRKFHADSGVITEEDREYIIVSLVEHPLIYSSFIPIRPIYL
jgi:hypothetical protein